MRTAAFIATWFLAASAAAQTIYCCTSNDQDQVVPENDETAVCCQSSGGELRGFECVLDVGHFGFRSSRFKVLNKGLSLSVQKLADVAVGLTPGVTIVARGLWETTVDIPRWSTVTEIGRSDTILGGAANLMNHVCVANRCFVEISLESATFMNDRSTVEA
ncbi:hypothetical protein CGCTS75_v007594 [Colletotrichum tropicale]|nr:hypothetical protein CGCTS75_v007594 [Colletotrichum tropicale]